MATRVVVLGKDQCGGGQGVMYANIPFCPVAVADQENSPGRADNPSGQAGVQFGVVCHVRPPVFSYCGGSLQGYHPGDISGKSGTQPLQRVP